MERKFTKGPWEVSPDMQWNNGAKVYEINYGEYGEVVAESVYEKEDANLIAAAPDLYEALEEMVNRFVHYAETYNDIKAIAQGREALKKAKGE